MELQEFVKEITPTINAGKHEVPVVSDEQWLAYEELVSVLRLVNITTIKMQSVKYVPSDCYADWTNLKLKLKNHDHAQIAKDIVENMVQRERGLIDNPTVLASVLLDPRFRVLLSNHEIATAIKHLSIVRRRLKIGTESAARENDTTENDATLPKSNDSDLIALIQQRKTANPLFSNCEADDQLLKRILALPLSNDLSLSPIEYWASLQKKEPILYEIASIVNAASPTETSVERCFSALGYIFNSRRTNLSEKSLRTILLTRLNKNLFLSDEFDFI